MDETPWEDINPPVMASARQPGLHSASSALTPATRTEFRDQLTACLILVAPAGMTEEARGEWLAIAWQELKHLPADLLEIGCRHARRTCDHPSKIVPTIIAETSDWIRRRREAAKDEARPALLPPRKSPFERRGEPMSEAETEELNKFMANLGATARYRTDGSRYHVEPSETVEDRSHPRTPTKADYIALGVDPAILDQIPQPKGA